MQVLLLILLQLLRPTRHNNAHFRLHHHHNALLRVRHRCHESVCVFPGRECNTIIINSCRSDISACDANGDDVKFARLCDVCSDPVVVGGTQSFAVRGFERGTWKDLLMIAVLVVVLAALIM